MNRLAAAAAILGALAVVFGAFGAHALRGILDTAALQLWHTAVEYQFWHALALLAAACAPASRWRNISAFSLLAGCIAFCGSLYALALGAPRIVGAITPLGGVCFIVGWLALAGIFWRTER